MSIGLDASSLVSPGEEEGYIQLNVPNVRPSRYGLAYSFKTGLPDFSALWPWSSDNCNGAEEEPLQDEKSKGLGDSPEITFQATVGGAIRRTKQSIELAYTDGTSGTVKVSSFLAKISEWGILMLISTLTGRWPTRLGISSIRLECQH